MNITLISNIVFEPYWKDCIKNNSSTFFNRIKSKYILYNESEYNINDIESADIVVICLNFEVMYPNYSIDIINKKITYEDIEKDCIEKCSKLYSTIKARTDALIIWFGFEDYSCLQSYICGTILPYNGLVDKINLELKNMLNCSSFIDLKHIIASIGISNAYNLKGKYRWNAPYSKELIYLIIKEINKQYYITSGITKKCIVLDCDNVLWGGILSEDGIEGIQVSNSGLGRPFQDFQRYLLNLYYHGVILSVCSKNDEADVLRVFHEHRGMLLKEEHIAFFQCNWDNKPNGIVKISEVLNIGLDSMVFIDDTDFEVEAVKALLSEVVTIKYNRNTVYEQLSCFNLKSDTDIATIRDRNNTYKTNSLRNKLESVSLSFDDYIQSLKMHIDIHVSLPSELSRISELTLRTNKCTNGKRYTLEQLKTKISNNSYTLYSVYVSDRFSDLGLVGTFGINGDLLDIFALSCRALGRNVEMEMLELICKMGIYTISYKSTGKNGAIHAMLLEKLRPTGI